ncbi:MAG: hypothetical protein CL532_10935 [Aestuariivita sp.]|nr:hypothetical protein [Aestuariivita sp.]
MRFIMVWFSLWCGVGLGAHAQTSVYDQLYAALHLNDIVKVIRDEGLEEAKSTAEIYLKSQGQIASFNSQIDSFYDITNISTFLLNGISTGLMEQDAEMALMFYTRDLGAKIASLEASARLAISDSAVESMAIEIAKSAKTKDSKRYKLLQENMKQMELVEQNLKGAFASQYGFLTELSKATDINLSQDQILSLLSGSEEDLRKEVTDWLMGYSYMAYQPISDDELQLYLDFLANTSGKALNGALFNVFNALSVKTSSALGELIALLREARDL